MTDNNFYKQLKPILDLPIFSLKEVSSEKQIELYNLLAKLSENKFVSWETDLENILGDEFTNSELDIIKQSLFENFIEPVLLKELNNRALIAIVKNQNKHLNFQKANLTNLLEAKKLLAIFDFTYDNNHSLSAKELSTQIQKLLGIKLTEDDAKAIKQAIYHKSIKSISSVIAELAADEFIKAEDTGTVAEIKNLNVSLINGKITDVIKAMKNLGVSVEKVSEDDLATILTAQQLLDQPLELQNQIFSLQAFSDLTSIDKCAAKLEVILQSSSSKKIRESAMEKLQGLKIQQIEFNKIFKLAPKVLPINNINQANQNEFPKLKLNIFKFLFTKTLRMFA